jgi:hypothetical protein
MDGHRPSPDIEHDTPAGIGESALKRQTRPRALHDYTLPRRRGANTFLQRGIDRGAIAVQPTNKAE